MRVVLALLATATAVAIPAAAGAQRLPAGVAPEHYTLWFAPDLEKATFRGRETIEVRLDAPSTAVTLHAAEITFEQAEIAAGGKTQTATVQLRREDRDRYAHRAAAHDGRAGDDPHHLHRHPQ